MIINCVSDLHGHYPELEGGDLLIVAGDLTARDLSEERIDFLIWLADQNYRKKIWIAGNHDNSLIGLKFNPTRPDAADYLCDSGTEFEGLKIWGSPWTLRFPGMNPKCMAFTVDTEQELAEKWAMIPEDVDILVTHSPPKFGLDKTGAQEHVGSDSLRDWLFVNEPKLHIFGHVHENYGIITHENCVKLARQFNTIEIPNFLSSIIYITRDRLCKTTLVNACHVNENYEPVNSPIRVIL